MFSFLGARQNKPSFNSADTSLLVTAVAFGKGLSKCRPPGPVAPGHSGQGSMMSGGPTLQQVTIGGGAGQQAGMGGPVAQQQQGQPGRRPSLVFLLQTQHYTQSGCSQRNKTTSNITLGGYERKSLIKTVIILGCSN